MRAVQVVNQNIVCNFNALDVTPEIDQRFGAAAERAILNRVMVDNEIFQAQRVKRPADNMIVDKLALAVRVAATDPR